LGKIPENPGKIPQYLGKIPENLGKNGAHRCLTSKNGTQYLQKNKWRSFLEVAPKKGLNNLCGRRFLGKSRTTTFRASLGKFGQKSFAIPKICLLLHLYERISWNLPMLHVSGTIVAHKNQSGRPLICKCIGIEQYW